MVIEAAIFDMDGLMFDTERLHISIWERLEKECGFHFRDGMPDMTGMNATAVAKLYREKYGDSFDYDALLNKRRRYAEEHIERYGVPIKPGLRELLATLDRLHIRRALATSTDRKSAMKLIRTAGLESCFQVMVFGDEVQCSKPNPEIFLTAAKKLGSMPERSLVLEDSINGASAGCNGGFPTVMVPDLLQPDQALEARLTGKFDSLLDVIPFVTKIPGKAEV